MSLYRFENITKDHSFLGGKGFTLGLMKNAGFQVPAGLILTTLPVEENEWNEIFSWWKENGTPKLAVRSSAVGEDSSEHSFAGQNSTYLNINSEKDIKSAILKCFQSINKNSSVIYRQHFLKEKSSNAKMNVVLQVMVAPLISGVFFSVDPRTSDEGWIVEAIEGLGEDLVSGRKTPWHFEEKNVTNTALFDLESLIRTGKSIKDFFGFEIDMEWAIDENHVLQILQSRPVTALSGKSEKKRLIEQEISRLEKTYPKETVWDGTTFAEWSGPPTELTFSIWKEAFSKNHAFSKALKKIGYLGIDQEILNENHSLLERIFNRGYVNITMLAPLYFGPIPYRIEFKKSFKLKFDFSKMNAKTILLTPFTIFRMIKVSLDLSTRRREWVNECEKELNRFTLLSFRVKDQNYYKDYADEKLLDAFKDEVETFYEETLVSPLVLITLIETTTQNLRGLLKGVMTDEVLDQKINEWLAVGLHTVTMDMNHSYKEACALPEKRHFFLQKYGHRGPGELELSNLRWGELGDHAFVNLSSIKTQLNKKITKTVEEQIQELKTYKVQVILKEWLLLKEMLELREKWKMQLLSSYSHIRFIALEIAKRFQLEENVFWFSFQEIINKNFDLNKAQKRKLECELSKSIYLPSIIEIQKLKEIFSNKVDSKTSVLHGVPLSPGISFGEVRVVLDPENVNTDEWPENTILVAESTDPGWSGLFLKSIGVIVEKGGVLSHCAIVAREMGLPAVSGIKTCHLRFKDGDKIWVDGNNGRITLA